MALTYLNSKMIEEPASFDQIYVISLTALSSTVQNTLTNDLTAINVTGDSVINVDTPGNALRVTQRGIGNALVVEDSTNPDSTPFVVNNLGRVGIGVASPTTELDVNGTIKGNTILGTNVNVTGTGTFQTVNATGVTTQNVIFPQSGGGSIVNDAAFYGNLTIYGAISALSGLSVTSTFTSQSSALSVVNTGPEIALFVSQGPNLSGVATFIGSGTEVLKVNNPNPNPLNLPAVVVTGVLSASGGTSTNWNSVYTNVQSNSANWNSAYVTTTALSSNFWNSVYTNVQTNSANYVLQGGNTLAVDLSVGTTNTRNVVIETNNIERMRISSGGNVGIGTTNPGEALTVQGNLSASGLYFGSLKYISVNSNFNALPDASYLVNTSVSSVTATLPTQPQNGDTIRFNDAFTTWNTNNFVVSSNDKIAGLFEPLICNVGNTPFYLTYSNPLTGWRLAFDATNITGSFNTPPSGSITTAMLADSSVNVVKLANSVQQLLVPAGCVMSFAMSAAPTGWYPCDGTTISRTGSGANLFAAIGTTYGVGDNSTTFNVPNLQGQFIRGLTTNLSTASRDPLSGSRALGSVQSDEFRSHAHTLLGQETVGTFQAGSSYSLRYSPITQTTDLTGGAETRPVNIALLYCIKL